MEKLSKISIENFLEKLASAEPAPGGGSAAALAGALAAALTSMVANLTLGKKQYAAQQLQCEAILKEAQSLQQKFLKMIAEDVLAFIAFMDCYKLPKTSEQEKKLRLEAISSAAKAAAEAPLSVAIASLEVLKLAEQIAQCGNSSLISDAACSAILARAVLRCAAYNVHINLKLTKDEDYNQAALAKLVALSEQAENLEKRVLTYVEEHM